MSKNIEGKKREGEREWERERERASLKLLSLWWKRQGTLITSSPTPGLM